MLLPVQCFRPRQHFFLFAIEMTAQRNSSVALFTHVPHIKQAALNTHLTGLHLQHSGPLLRRKQEYGIGLAGCCVMHHYIMPVQEYFKNARRSLSQQKQGGQQDQGHYFSASEHQCVREAPKVHGLPKSDSQTFGTRQALKELDRMNLHLKFE